MPRHSIFAARRALESMRKRQLDDTSHDMSLLQSSVVSLWRTDYAELSFNVITGSRMDDLGQQLEQSVLVRVHADECIMSSHTSLPRHHVLDECRDAKLRWRAQVPVPNAVREEKDIVRMRTLELSRVLVRMSVDATPTSLHELALAHDPSRASARAAPSTYGWRISLRLHVEDRADLLELLGLSLV